MMTIPMIPNPDEKFKSKMPGADKWLARLNEIIKQSPVNPKINNKSMAFKLGTSERDLFRKVKKLTGLSPQKYLRQYYLHQAMQYLKDGIYKTVKETSVASGYSNVSYFITQFEKEFGKKPLQVLKEEGWR